MCRIIDSYPMGYHLKFVPHGIPPSSHPMGYDPYSSCFFF